MRTDASKTALLIAGYRARISQRDDALFADPWAAALAGDEGIELSRGFDTTFPTMEHWVELRTTAIDRLLENATRAASAKTQVVMLGAGLDTRAARLGGSARQFYEVDHPATQLDKRSRVADLDGYAPANVTYVSCDFEDQDFLDRLIASGFNADAPAFVVWEGVVPYLTEPAVRATLERVATGCHPETAIVFDTISTRMARRENISELDEESMDFVEHLGEPVIFGVNHTIELVAAAGFSWAHAATFDELCLNLTGRYDRASMFRFQHLTVASRAAQALWPL